MQRQPLRHAWWRWRGEQPLLTTFWPQDYERGTNYHIGDRAYRITRYVRAADPRFFEVWGQTIAPYVAPREHDHAIRTRLQAHARR